MKYGKNAELNPSLTFTVPSLVKSGHVCSANHTPNQSCPRPPQPPWTDGAVVARTVAHGSRRQLSGEGGGGAPAESHWHHSAPAGRSRWPSYAAGRAPRGRQDTRGAPGVERSADWERSHGELLLHHFASSCWIRVSVRFFKGLNNFIKVRNYFFSAGEEVGGGLK